MNIMMLGRWLPPPRQAVRATREYKLAQHLARNHRVTLAFITDNPDAGGSISALRAAFGDLEFAAVPRGWKSLVSAVRLATGESCTLSYVRSEALRTRLADRLKSTPYGLVFVTSSSMIQYALEIDPAIPLVVDFAEVESEWWFRQAAQRVFPGTRFFKTEAIRLRTAEAAAARRAIAGLAATERAAAIVRGLVPHTPVIVIPNGVEVSGAGAGARPGTSPTVVVAAPSGDAAQIHDVARFWRGFLPAIRTKVPAIRVVVVSREPMAPSGAAEFEGAEIAAPVSDFRRFLDAQTVVVAPLGSDVDVRAAVVEPMAAGVPVVATPALCQLVGAAAGRDLLVADQPVDFAREVVRLLENASFRREVADQGRRFVEASCSWGAYAARVTELIERVLRLPKTAAAAPAPPRGIAAVLKK
jgi:hypothetical protein